VETICDEAEVTNLAMEAIALTDSLHMECGDLLVLVGEAREPE
jgi:hypothetical protein